MNPQTNVERYHHKHSVTAWAEVCKDPESGQILDLQKYYAGLPTQPRITYFQNKSDTHRGTHAEPFLESLETQPELVSANGVTATSRRPAAYWPPTSSQHSCPHRLVLSPRRSRLSSGKNSPP